jgi:hypothetical protein
LNHLVRKNDSLLNKYDFVTIFGQKFRQNHLETAIALPMINIIGYKYSTPSELLIQMQKSRNLMKKIIERNFESSPWLYC